MNVLTHLYCVSFISNCGFALGLYLFEVFSFCIVALFLEPYKYKIHIMFIYYLIYSDLLFSVSHSSETQYVAYKVSTKNRSLMHEHFMTPSQSETLRLGYISRGDFTPQK